MKSKKEIVEILREHLKEFKFRGKAK